MLQKQQQVLQFFMNTQMNQAKEAMPAAEPTVDDPIHRVMLATKVDNLSAICRLPTNMVEEASSFYDQILGRTDVKEGERESFCICG